MLSSTTSCEGYGQQCGRVEVPADHMWIGQGIIEGKRELDRTIQLRVPPRWEGQQQSRRSTEIALILARL